MSAVGRFSQTAVRAEKQGRGKLPSHFPLDPAQRTFAATGLVVCLSDKGTFLVLTHLEILEEGFSTRLLFEQLLILVVDSSNLCPQSFVFSFSDE